MDSVEDGAWYGVTEYIIGRSVHLSLRTVNLGLGDLGIFSLNSGACGCGTRRLVGNPEEPRGRVIGTDEPDSLVSTNGSR